jgi:arylsulfatase A-like enzyme
MLLLRSLAVAAISLALPGLAFFESRGLAVDAGRVQQSPPRRPDVVIVLTDQQRADAFGAAGAADLHTPVMDRIAGQGVQFTRAFAATPQCSPSRAALLTGLYPHRTGVMGNTGAEGEGRAGRASAVRDGQPSGAAMPEQKSGGAPAGMSVALARSIPTLGRIFAAGGYETAYFGKWHLGGTPGEYGFDTHDSRLTDATLARTVVEFLQRRTASGERRPLLLMVSWLNPHDIYGVLNQAAPAAPALAAVRLPSNLVDDLRSKPRPQRRYLEEDQGAPFVGAGPGMWRRYRAFYNGLVETVDREIGTVLDAMPRADVSPITVFCTDHGDLGGAHGLPYKGPAMYEELVRVPLVISWPGRIHPSRSNALVSLIDLLPTLCDLTGAQAPGRVDGLSLRPILEQRASEVRQLVFAEYYGKQSWRVPIRMVRSSRWKYVRYRNDGEELYDLTADPGELRNLASDRGAATERTHLARELDGWIRATADPFASLTTTDRSGRVLSAEEVK